MADVLAVRDEFRLRNWMEIIREYQDSGLSNRVFCAQRRIAEKKYYYWLRKVRMAAGAAVEPQLVRLEEAPKAVAGHMIEIRYGDTELKLPADVDLKALAVFLMVMKQLITLDGKIFRVMLSWSIKTDSLLYALLYRMQETKSLILLL